MTVLKHPQQFRSEGVRHPDAISSNTESGIRMEIEKEFPVSGRKMEDVGRLHNSRIVNIYLHIIIFRREYFAVYCTLFANFRSKSLPDRIHRIKR